MGRHDKSCFEVSDTGPDTIGQFIEALESIKTTENKIEIKCFLEPSVLEIILEPSATIVQVTLRLDGVETKGFDFERCSLIAALDSELRNLIPQCVNPNWTHANWNHN